MKTQAIVGLVTSITITLLASTPAKAQDFDALLQSALNPEEVTIHQQRGSAKAEQLARQACTSLDAGTSVRDFASQVSQSLLEEKIAPDQVATISAYSGKIIAFGIAIFCPQHLQKIEELELERP